MDEDRFSRNISLFGPHGQEAISNAKVSIVGLGGLGSHVAQQLAYLGVINFALIDADMVSESSLNRVVGVTPADVQKGASKVSCADRAIRSIQPDAVVKTATSWVTAARDSLAELLGQSDVVFGCIDKEAPRLFLTDLAADYRMTYFDLATDTGGELEDWYGGRVVCAKGAGCLSCLDLLDQRLIRLEQMTDVELEVERRIYGLNADVLGTGPSVVSVNGVVASLAVTEFMVLVTGIREPATQLIYRGDIPRLTTSKDRGRQGCPYCSRWAANS